MKYSKTTNYTFHTMPFLAMDISNKLVGVQKLAEKQKVSPTYLSPILTKLVEEEIILG
ncbi:Rrf2 family transcriptional regulator [Tissierella praeacuta]|uniref:Rrf2 family transcriptional regulator n=1 Tax=Tissierella praeacuta TaxID=43131 RepID=UPI00334249AF